jgi:LPXTG-motif cell wall-anchored protein
MDYSLSDLQSLLTQGAGVYKTLTGSGGDALKTQTAAPTPAKPVAVVSPSGGTNTKLYVIGGVVLAVIVAAFAFFRRK